MDDLTLNEEALLAPPTQEELDAVANLYYDEYIDDSEEFEPIENMAGDWHSGPPPREGTPRWHAMRAEAEGNFAERDKWLDVYYQQKSSNKQIKQSVFGGGSRPSGASAGSASGGASPSVTSVADKWSAAAAASTGEAERSGSTIAHTRAAALHLHAALSNTSESLARARAASAHRKELVKHAKKAGSNVADLYKAWRSGTLGKTPPETGFSSGAESWSSAAPTTPGSATMRDWTSTARAVPSQPEAYEPWTSAVGSESSIGPDESLRELRRKYGIGSEVSETVGGSMRSSQGPKVATTKSGTEAWTSSTGEQDTALRELKAKYGKGSTSVGAVAGGGNCGTGAGGFKPGNTCAGRSTNNSLASAIKLVGAGIAGGAVLGGMKGAKAASKEIGKRQAEALGKRSFDKAWDLANLAVETPKIADKHIRTGIKQGAVVGGTVAAGVAALPTTVKATTAIGGSIASKVKKKKQPDEPSTEGSKDNCGIGPDGFQPGNTCASTNNINIVENWSEADHPRDEDGKFTEAQEASEKAHKATEVSKAQGHKNKASVHEALQAHWAAKELHKKLGNKKQADEHKKQVDVLSYYGKGQKSYALEGTALGAVGGAAATIPTQAKALLQMEKMAPGMVEQVFKHPGLRNKFLKSAGILGAAAAGIGAVAGAVAGHSIKKSAPGEHDTPKERQLLPYLGKKLGLVKNVEDESMLTAEYRGRLIKGIVANCKCNSEVEAALNQEDDNSLLEIAANALTVNAYPPQQKPEEEMAQEEEASGEDTQEDTAEENQKGSNPAQSKMGSHCMNEEQWLATAPPSIRSVVQNAMEFEKGQKAELVTRIVANASNVFSKDYLLKKDLKELQGIAALAVNARKSTNSIAAPIPHFAGAATVERLPTANKEMSINEDADMVPPVINYSELSKSRK